MMTNLVDLLQPRSRFGIPVLSRLAARWNAFSAERRQRAQIERELNTYTDRELAELGLCRSDIVDVANGTYGQ
ncbi:MAG: DUF1127 domain-containing protein [Azospirillaceae bacterium]|nr:DUF1127 domain-containing protein [Azospirillaceae bacterium]